MIDYDKWINNYIDGVNIDDIEWLCLNIDELNNFSKKNINTIKYHNLIIYSKFFSYNQLNLIFVNN